MARTVYEACTERRKTPKILIINDSAISSSSSSSFFVNLSETFRDNIRSFLRDYAEIEDYTLDGNTVYCFFLASQATGVVFPLFTIEELVSDSSPNPLCDFCRCVGWGHHYVSKRKYHFIIPKSDEWKKPLTTDSLEATSHLMHGVIHCNGFGHLLCINTDDDDSHYLSGEQSMDLWDRLCSTLHTRKISLDDISKKGSMDLRLLHGVAYGRPWFGKWGYMFSRGSFGIRKEQYWRAILTLSSMEIDKIIDDFSGKRKERVMNMIIDFYRESSETPLATVSDLLRFMLAFRSKTPVQKKNALALAALSLDPVSNPILGDDENIEMCSSHDQVSDDDGYVSGRDTVLDDDHDDTMMADIKPIEYDSFEALSRGENSRWSGRRLKEAAQAVLKVFKERNSTITRQELREAVRNSIGDTGLIDFLLKHIDKVLMGDQIVQRFTNPRTRMLQFSLGKINSRALEKELKKKRKPKPKPKETDVCTSTTPGVNPYDDILYLYQSLLLTYPDSDIYSEASEVILSGKSFVKEWSYQEQNPLTVSCQVLPNHEELLKDFTRLLPPGELVVVPQNATIRELKSAAEKALRDTYFLMETFEVLEIRSTHLEMLEDNLGLKSQGKTEFFVKGFGLDTGTELRYEGGFDDWTVDCKCGARDDDGERMVACDACKVWHHTLCNSIEDGEAVPSVFLCNRCYGDSLRSKKRSLTIR